MFGRAGCVLTAFTMYFIGCSSIFLMCAISNERLLIVNKSNNQSKFDRQFCARVLSYCLFGGLFWSVMPLLGWSEYALEGAQTTCSVEWNKRTANVLSYNIAIFVFVFFVPLVYICITNFKLFIVVRNFNRQRQNVLNPCKTVRKEVNMERKLTAIIILLICLYTFYITLQREHLIMFLFLFSPF